MMLRVITIFTGIIAVVTAYSCNSDTSNKTKLDTLAVSNVIPDKKIIDADTIYKKEVTKNNDAVVLDNSSYLVTTKPNEGESGDLIKIYNKVTKKSFTLTGDENFVEVKDHFLITEAGTTVNYRSFSVYDLNTSEMVFSSGYEADLDIENNMLGFKIAVTLTNPALIPKCNPQQKIPLDNLGYVEQQYYDLKNNTLKKTGQYECWYFE